MPKTADVINNTLRWRSRLMIRTLVQSALKTGCLSVASEGLIRQVLEMKGYEALEDLEALTVLQEAVKSGQIEREARGDSAISLISNSR